jgi:type IV pilus assembly protein PilW
MNTPLIMQKLQPRSNQRGMGLVELMISLLIGLILLGTLAYIYLGTQQTSRTHDDLSRMEESGRNAMEIIGKAVRQAGFRLDVNSTFSTSSNGIGAIFGTEGGGTGASAPSDTLTIRHDPAWAVATAANPTLRGREANCAGAVVNSTDVLPLINVVEYVFNINQTTPALRCGTNAATAAVGGVIVDNIERMQLTYGLRDATGAITSYVPANLVTAWNQVVAVRVSLLVRGPSAGITANNSQTYTFNGQTFTSTDGFLRQVYTSTFTVRNQAL